MRSKDGIVFYIHTTPMHTYRNRRVEEAKERERKRERVKKTTNTIDKGYAFRDVNIFINQMS